MKKNNFFIKDLLKLFKKENLKLLNLNNTYLTIRDKSNLLAKFIFKTFNNAQDKIEKSFKSLVFDESLLRQSDFWVKSVTWTLIGTSSFMFVWLALAKTDEVVIAVGKLEPKGDVKDIQIPIGGVVEEIFVETGDVVNKDERLIQLDRESAYGQYISLKSAIEEKEVQLDKNISILLLKNIQKEEEAKLNSEKLILISNKLKINEEILNSFEQLIDEGAVSNLELLEQKIKFNELKSSLKQVKIEGKRNSSLTNQQIKNLESEQAKIKTELSSLNSQLIRTKVNLKYLSINSPVKGVVFDLKPTSSGYVAQSSEPIMKIVPFNELEADIEIPSNKIGFVKLDMPVEISIDSFPASDFGVVNGKLKSIGSDALPPSQIDQRIEYSYPAVVSLDNQELLVKNGVSLPLQVGMSLTANIKLRKVSYVQLLFRTLSNRVDSLKKM
tara:strand:- start:1673 stop:2995 length:1323 start_codon:yes stop_codon:yes gene_type:complete